MHPLPSRVLFPLLALVSSLPAQGEVEARSAVRKGGSVWLVHEANHDVTVEMQGQEVVMSQKTSRTVHVQVEDVDADGNYLVATRLVRVHGRLVLPMGQGDVDFDSAASAEGEGEQAAFAREMTKSLIAGAGMTFTAKVGPAGEVLELGKGAAEIVAAHKGAASNMHQLTSGALKQLVADAFGLVPAKRTAGGAKWTRERLEVHGRMPTRQKLDLTLATVAPEAFEIEGVGTLELALDVLAGDKELRNEDDDEFQRQVKSTKVVDGRITLAQKTSRQDGFVLQASSSIALDLETAESQMGAVTTRMKLSTSLRRTTAADALPKKAEAPEGAKKQGAGG